MRAHAVPRVIPVLLLEDGRLVKTREFDEPVYVGDPVNVLSIFNDFEVDEMFLLDIGAARRRRQVDVDSLKTYASECFIPLAYGGGIRSLSVARDLVAAGFEKVVIGSVLAEDPAEVEAISSSLGSQAVVAALDVSQMDGEYRIRTRGALDPSPLELEEWARRASLAGVGEVLVTSIDRDGTRRGYDLDLVRLVAGLVDVPVVANGGAGHRSDLVRAVEEAGASAVAAGSLFVFQGERDSVLINYPSRPELDQMFGVDAGSTGLAGDRDPARHGAGSGRVLRSGAVCSRCLITSDVPGSDFDASGVCYYCRLHDSLEAQFPTGELGRRQLDAFTARLRREGRGRRYDCILGVSGGCDSSYLAHLMAEAGVRPLAVHFDNTWNSPIATSNIYAVLDKLGIDLETYVVDNVEYDDIYRSFMLAGVRDVEAPTDIGFMGVLYRAAEKHGIKHIIEGHSFRTEGVSPLGWLYMDGGYVKSVHEQFGSVPMKTYPNMEFWPFVRWAALSGIERTRPLYHLDYHKEDAKALLSRQYGWQWYGGHHLENRFTAFYHSYLLPRRFGIDFRLIEFSALVRSGQMDRDDAAARLAEERQADPELLALVKKRLRFSDAEFDAVMTMPQHTYAEFDTYKSRFRRMRPFFWAMYKAGRVPRSFYVKFCT